MKGDDDYVVLGCQQRDCCHGQIDIKQLPRQTSRRESNHRDAQFAMPPAGDVALAPRVSDADVIQGGHRCTATLLPEIERMIVGETHDIESGCAQKLRITSRRPKQIARIRILAFLNGLAAVLQDSFKIAERDVGSTECWGHGAEETDAVIIG